MAIENRFILGLECKYYGQDIHWVGAVIQIAWETLWRIGVDRIRSTGSKAKALAQYLHSVFLNVNLDHLISQVLSMPYTHVPSF